MADFNQATKWLKEGKTVRREYWNNEIVCGKSDHVWSGKKMQSGIYFYNINKIDMTLPDLRFDISDFSGKDWEIYCEEHDWYIIHQKGCGLNDYACKELKCNYPRCKNCGVEKPNEELKTLKGLVNDGDMNKGDAWVIKQEAIKWVKPCPICDVPRFVCEGCSKMIRFHNITEEDLK